MAVTAGALYFGWSETNETPTAFVSEDGITWIRVEDPAQTAEFVAASEQRDPIELLPRPGEEAVEPHWLYSPKTAANGEAIVRVSWDSTNQIWATIDSGETWQETTTDDPAFPWNFHTSNVIAFGNGFVVVGSAGDGDAGVWIGEWIEGE